MMVGGVGVDMAYVIVGVVVNMFVVVRMSGEMVVVKGELIER